MPRTVFFMTLVGVLSAPSVCPALLYSVEGNKPQPAGNYERWPGLVDVVNQPSRRLLVWCNGAETFSYVGNEDALNATLKDFARVKAATRTVVFRPGVADQKADWELHIVEGIVRAYIQQEGIAPVRSLDPELIVYVDEGFNLNAIRIPAGIKVQQLRDIRSKCAAAQKSNDERLKSEAKEKLSALMNDPVHKKLGKTRYQAQLKRIAAFVERSGR